MIASAPWPEPPSFCRKSCPELEPGRTPCSEIRPKAALASKHASGARLGNPTNLTHAGALGRATQIAAADEFVSGLLPVVLAIRQTGAKTLEAMSQALNQRGIRTARGGKWHASSVANLFVARNERKRPTNHACHAIAGRAKFAH